MRRLVFAFVVLLSVSACEASSPQPTSSAQATDGVQVDSDPREFGSSCERFAEANSDWVAGDVSVAEFKVALDFVAVTAKREGNEQIEADARTMRNRLREDQSDDPALDEAYERLLEACEEVGSSG